MRFFAILLFTIAGLSSGIAASPSTRDFADLFAGREGCFVLYDTKDDSYIRHNPAGCGKRFSPCSTFKIPHTVIALHTGVASGPEFSLAWDGVKRSIPEWNRDQTLRSAFQSSVVWYYQELARRIGLERETEFVRKFNYGNMDLSGGLTNFWLHDSLLISADEQIKFLQRLWVNKLPVSTNAQQLTRGIMQISQSSGRTFYGKTGTGGDLREGVARLGWFVGCVQFRERTVFFATRITGPRDASGKEARKITEAILTRLGI